MNLKDFEKTQHQGLYISKIAHETFGKKYITRFQLNKKRYMKVLGYSKADNLSMKDALKLMNNYKNSLKLSKPIKKETSKKVIVEDKKPIVKQSNDCEKIKEDYSLMKSLLKDYKTLSATADKISENPNKPIQSASKKHLKNQLVMHIYICNIFVFS